MSKYIEFEFCELPSTPYGFDKEKFLAGDKAQIKLYKDNKTPNRKALITHDDAEEKGLNYARVVPKGCMFIDFDDPEEAEKMREIIINAKLRCLILKTMHGYHFLFRMPTFYEKQMTGATNWFGYKFDTKGTTDTADAVQILRACGMDRVEVASWEPDYPIKPEAINIEALDVLPYWLWGHLKDKDLYKGGRPR